MFRITRIVALTVLAAVIVVPVAAQTPGPPDWNDSGKSVYLAKSEKSQPAHEPMELAQPLATAAVANQQGVRAMNKIESPVVPAAHVETSPVEPDASRRLAPPSVHQAGELTSTKNGEKSASPRRLMDFGIPTESIYTIATALAIVIGSFLLFAWALRRGGRGAAGRRAMLPADAVSVLGRVPLASRQVAELLRVGNKLVLVAITTGGAETLTEITDPVEVDRLMGLCQQGNRHSTTQAFEQVFQNMTREPVASGFLGADSLPPSLTPVSAAYRSHRGDRARV